MKGLAERPTQKAKDRELCNLREYRNFIKKYLSHSAISVRHLLSDRIRLLIDFLGIRLSRETGERTPNAFKGLSDAKTTDLCRT